MKDLASLAAGRVRRAVPLAPLTTYKFGGPARYFLEATDEEDLLGAAEALQEDPHPVLILGRGSNVVVADAGFDGLVVVLGEAFSYVTIEPEGMVAAGGATPLPRIARETVRAGLGGLEFYNGIPGSVGGAVRMNAGGHGSDTAAWLQSARVVDLAAGRVRVEPAGDLGLAYRTSALGALEVVVEATFRTFRSTRREGEARLREIARWRRDHQPGGTLNAGSVFKNPPGHSAGRLIDEAGLKGFRIGAASVSHKHANFFEAGPGASAQDVYDLVHVVRREIGERTGVWLEPEVQFAGRFAASPTEGSG